MTHRQKIAPALPPGTTGEHQHPGFWSTHGTEAKRSEAEAEMEGRGLTRNFRSLLPVAALGVGGHVGLVTVLMSSHSWSVGSGLCSHGFCSSSRRLFSQFSSMSFLLAVDAAVGFRTTAGGEGHRTDILHTAGRPAGAWRLRGGHLGVRSSLGGKLPPTSHCPPQAPASISQSLANFQTKGGRGDTLTPWHLSSTQRVTLTRTKQSQVKPIPPRGS